MTPKVDFIDSERVSIDGQEGIYLWDQSSLLRQILNRLKSIGAEKFFSDPSRDAQRSRESLAIYFFVSALKKESGRDQWILQPHDDPPDFVVMTFDEDPIVFTLDQFELVEINDRCETFDEVMSVLDRKIKKGYPKNLNLLIFINHENSKTWVDLLYKQLEADVSFRSIWTVHLLFKNESQVYSAIVNRIRPTMMTIAADFDDSDVHRRGNPPGFTEIVKTEKGMFVQLRKEYADELRKTILKAKLRIRRG